MPRAQLATNVDDLDDSFGPDSPDDERADDAVCCDNEVARS